MRVGAVPANERDIRYGGLMRCCIATVHESSEPSVPGTIMDCKYEHPGNENLRVADDGIWEWNR